MDKELEEQLNLNIITKSARNKLLETLFLASLTIFVFILTLKVSIFFFILDIPLFVITNEHLETYKRLRHAYNIIYGAKKFIYSLDHETHKSEILQAIKYASSRMQNGMSIDDSIKRLKHDLREMPRIK